MKRRLANVMKYFGDQRGFTLIEMAVVLIIIGIIIGAVVKGKDLIRGAEQKRLYSTFLNGWQVAYSSYYDRTGTVLGDTNTVDNSGSRDGHCSNPSETNANAQLTRVGLETPTEGSSGSTTTRNYTDSQGRAATVTVTFRYNSSHGNYIRLDRLPNELGVAWDKMVDGQTDGTTGSFLYVPNRSSMGTTSDWPSAEDDPVSTSSAILKLAF